MNIERKDKHKTCAPLVLIASQFPFREKTEIIESKYQRCGFCFANTSQRCEMFKNTKSENGILDDNGRELNARSSMGLRF